MPSEPIVPREQIENWKLALGRCLDQLYHARFQESLLRPRDANTLGLNWGRGIDPTKDDFSRFTPARVVNTAEVLLAFSNLSLARGLDNDYIVQLEKLAAESLNGLCRNREGKSYFQSHSRDDKTIRANALPALAAMALNDHAHFSTPRRDLTTIATLCGPVLIDLMPNPRHNDKDVMFERVLATKALIQAAVLLRRLGEDCDWDAKMELCTDNYISIYRQEFSTPTIVTPGILARSIEVLLFRARKMTRCTAPQAVLIAERLAEKSVRRLLELLRSALAREATQSCPTNTLDPAILPNQNFPVVGGVKTEGWLDFTTAWVLDGLVTYWRYGFEYAAEDLNLIAQCVTECFKRIAPSAVLGETPEPAAQTPIGLHGPLFGYENGNETGGEYKIYHAAVYTYALGECIRMVEALNDRHPTNCAALVPAGNPTIQEPSADFIRKSRDVAIAFAASNRTRIYNRFEALEALAAQGQDPICRKVFLDSLTDFYLSDYENPERFNLTRHLVMLPALCRHAMEFDRSRGESWQAREREAVLLLLAASHHATGCWTFAPVLPINGSCSYVQWLRAEWARVGGPGTLAERPRAIAEHHKSKGRENADCMSTAWTVCALEALLPYCVVTNPRDRLHKEVRTLVRRGLNFLHKKNRDWTTGRATWTVKQEKQANPSITASLQVLSLFLAAFQTGIRVPATSTEMHAACTTFLSRRDREDLDETEADPYDTFSSLEDVRSPFYHSPFICRLRCATEYARIATHHAETFLQNESQVNEARSVLEAHWERLSALPPALNERDLELEPWMQTQYLRLVLSMRNRVVASLDDAGVSAIVKCAFTQHDGSTRLPSIRIPKVSYYSANKPVELKAAQMSSISTFLAGGLAAIVQIWSSQAPIERGVSRTAIVLSIFAAVTCVSSIYLLRRLAR